MFRSRLYAGCTFGFVIAIVLILLFTMNTVAADSSQSGNRVWDPRI